MTRTITSIIPGGTIQFIDLDAVLFNIPKSRVQFCEAFIGGDVDGKDNWKLFCLAQDGNNLIDLQSGQQFLPPSKEYKTYGLNIEKCLEPFLDSWIPVPFFRVSGAPIDEFRQFRNGPTDWSRLRINRSHSDENGNTTLKITLAFDTYSEDGDPYNPSGYAALTNLDVTEGAEFGLASNYNSLFAFLSNNWVRDWLEHQVLSYRKINGQSRRPQEYKTEALARYIGLIELLEVLDVLPSIKLIDPERYASIDVDLVLDIGNSRTIGMLVENPNGSDFSWKNGNTLELRDLSSKTSTFYRETFSSHICFSKAAFGDESGFSKDSMRIRPSFSWPSVVRVGEEAVKITSSCELAQGEAALSSPKRYLWDLRPRPVGEEWRYVSAKPDDPEFGIPVISGDFVAYINDFGMPLHLVGNRFNPKLISESQQGERYPVTQPRFSRSSMMMFLAAEIIEHALVQINSPKHRYERGNTETPRRLSRIMITVPPAMTLSERKIYGFWINAAVDVLWKALDWNESAIGGVDYRRKPQVVIKLDEASATQNVFIYNEVAIKFNGDLATFIKTNGKSRTSVPTLRVASIDIGGGTTDMVVISYDYEMFGTSAIIQPTQEFRESFNVAGDDLLRALIENHVIGQVFEALSIDPHAARQFGKDALGVTTREKHFRTQVAQKIFFPIALRLLEALKLKPIEDIEGSSITLNLLDVVSHSSVSKDLLTTLGAMDSVPFDSEKEYLLTFSFSELATTILKTIRRYLEDLSDVVERMDCDFLVFSGWASSLPVIQAVFYKKPPLMPSRIVVMSNYQIESWYPFQTNNGKIADPKTTGVVGALIAVSDGNLLNIHFKSNNLSASSTVKFIGQMRNNQQILQNDLLFQGCDLTITNSDTLADSLKLATPVNFGFRQFNVERWKTTPMYSLRFSNQSASQRASVLGLPYTVKISYERETDFETNQLEQEGFLKIDEIESSDGSYVDPSDLELVFRTLWDGDGHWFDTGLFDV
jgi:hypothetical protein